MTLASPSNQAIPDPTEYRVYRQVAQHVLQPEGKPLGHGVKQIIENELMNPQPGERTSQFIGVGSISTMHNGQVVNVEPVPFEIDAATIQEAALKFDVACKAAQDTEVRRRNTEQRGRIIRATPEQVPGGQPGFKPRIA